MDVFKEIFTTEGRLNRRDHFKYQTIWIALIVLATLSSGLLMDFLTGVPDSELGKSIGGFLCMIGLIGFCTILARRMHDLNMSGYFGLLIFVPVIGTFFLIYLFVGAGTAGANKYGEEPLTYE